MAGFQVSNKHIDALVYARSLEPLRDLAHLGHGTWTDNDLGRLLLLENLLSLAHRYPDRCRPVNEMAIDAYFYRSHRWAGFPVIALIKAVECYQYQACEHDTWEASQAADYCERLRNELIRRVPGWAEAPWGIRE